MKREHVLMIVIAFVIGFGISLLINLQKNENEQVCIESECFDVEVVNTKADRERGLMYREDLDSDSGMLFIFDREGIYPFWMKNTLIDLDIIWINEDKEIVFISKNTQPCEADPCLSVNPNKKAKYVLEINGGLSEENGFSIGDDVEFDLS
jgi:uncharacterized protein